MTHHSDDAPEHLPRDRAGIHERAPAGDQARISVITPSFNQGAFIRDTIESVLAQKTSNWEHIVIDGGSNDETVTILESYPHLRWVSEPDQGQSDALNKGLGISSGELVFWINSDDVVAPGAFAAARKFFSVHPDAQIVCGNAVTIDADGREIRRMGPRVQARQLRRPWNGSTSMHQPSLVFRRSVYDRVGPFDVQLRFAMDYDFFLRASHEYEIHHAAVDLGYFREYAGTKTGEGTVRSFREVRDCLVRFVDEQPNGPTRWTAARMYAAEACAWVNDAVAHYDRGRPEEARRLLVRAALRYPPSLLAYPHLRHRLRKLIGPSAFDALRRWLKP